jgi:integrase
MAMSRRAKITKQAVDTLEPGGELRDTELKGFGARCQLQSKTYFVLTRIHGRLKRLTIGRHGSPWTPETARREAARLLLDIRAGGDPASRRDDRRREKIVFEEVAQLFLETHGKSLKPRTVEEYGRIMKLQLGRAFNGMAMDDIQTADVARAHARLHQTPRAANHAIAVLSKLTKWAEQNGYREPGPSLVAGIKKYRENKRDRYLSDTEMTALGQTLVESEADQNPFVIHLIRMLLLTGARLSEMLTLKWAYVDLERACLRLPDSKSGAKTIVLSQAAVDVLGTIPRLSGNPWVFPGHIDGQHLVNIQKPWRAIRARAGLDDVRLHDLRHSFASTAVGQGGTLPVIGRLLGHSQVQTTARYAHVASNPAKVLADATGARILASWRNAAGPSPLGHSEKK